jgi:Cu(I)/Ag(I) efflux system membrane fusion protein
MKKRSVIIISIIVVVIFSLLLKRTFFSSKPIVNARQPLYWIDTMEPTIRYDKPGKSRMGMDVVPVYADDGQEESRQPTIKISAAVINNLGVRIASVTQGAFARPIETVGYVEPNENSISQVNTYAEGWIRQLRVKAVGETVKKGQLLFQLYSPTLINAQEEYLLALDSGSPNVSNASRKKLLTLGVSEEQIQQLQKTKKTTQLIDVYATQNGIISVLNVREGVRVTPEMEVMRLADLASIWMMAEVYESQANGVSVGQVAQARLPYLPGKIWQGTVEYVYPQVDATTRTVKTRLRFDNPDILFKPNMYVNITLFVNPRQNVLSIPREALIPSGTSTHVVVALGQGRFQPRTVVPGIESGDRVEIISGLTSGEKVVTSAQFLIDSEANLKATVDRMSRPTDKPGDKVNVTLIQQQPMSAPSTTPIAPASTPMPAKPKPLSEPQRPADIQGQGIIKAIDVKKHQLTISHQPIKALQWPAMTMDFKADTAVDLSKFNVGNTIHFTLKKTDKDEWMIMSVRSGKE